MTALDRVVPHISIEGEQFFARRDALAVAGSESDGAE